MAANGKRPTSWRCRNPKQQKDKQEIYNSREWRDLRILKLRANPLCEVCEQEGIVTAAHAVHHRHPIEESTSKAEMRKWAFMWDNLVSVCDACHAKIHKEMKSNSKQNVAHRRQLAHDRWAEAMQAKFMKKDDNENKS
ncbi:MAG: HNH endonuclease [Prevotella sp.]|nr:HNH endonuclease [Prevotella sp.]